MDEIIKMIKKKMVDQGRDDFTNYLAEILGVTKQWASAKLTGKSEFTVGELKTIVAALDISGDDIIIAFGE